MKVTSYQLLLLVFPADTRSDFGRNFDIIAILRIISLKFESDSILPPLDDQEKLCRCLSSKKLKVTTASVIDLWSIGKVSLSVTLVRKHHPDLYSLMNEILMGLNFV